MEDPDAVGAVVDAVGEDVDNVPVLDLALELVQELAAGVVILVQVEGLGSLRLGFLQECGEAHAGRGVVVLVVPLLQVPGAIPLEAAGVFQRSACIRLGSIQ